MGKTVARWDRNGRSLGRSDRLGLFESFATIVALVEVLGVFDQRGVILRRPVFQSSLGADIQGTSDKRRGAGGDISGSAEKK